MCQHHGKHEMLICFVSIVSVLETYKFISMQYAVQHCFGRLNGCLGGGWVGGCVNCFVSECLGVRVAVMLDGLMCWWMELCSVVGSLLSSRALVYGVSNV